MNGARKKSGPPGRPCATMEEIRKKESLMNWKPLLCAALCAAPFSASAYVDAVPLPAAFSDVSPAAGEARIQSGAYRLYRVLGADEGYFARDHSIFFAACTAEDALPPYTLGRRVLRIVLFLGKGTALPGGPAVGGPASSVIDAFGPVYPVSRSDIYENEPRTGMYTENTHAFPRGSGREDYRYYTLTYADKAGRHVQFLVGREDRTILCAAYWEGPSLAPSDAAAADALTRWGLWRRLFPPDPKDDRLQF